MAWNYIKQKPVPTPDANKNNKPVKVAETKKIQTPLQELVLLDPKNP